MANTIKSYVYNGTTYSSVSAVRKAILLEENKAFPAEPSEDIEEFWAELGVEYSESEMPIAAQKALKLAELTSAFNSWSSSAIFTSSLGFPIDADADAKMNVMGLAMSGEGTLFMDADNELHEFTAEQIGVIAKELMAAVSAWYAQKWAIRDAINNCETGEELDAVSIEFEDIDFSAADDDGEVT